MIIYVMLTVLSLLEFVPYQLLLKSCISFLLLRFKSINVAKVVKIFCNFQKLKNICPKSKYALTI